jgi:membrane protease YdiL (CAAX protease family)
MEANAIFTGGPSRRDAFLDIAIYVLAGAALWFGEEALRSAGRFPYPGLLDGAFALIGMFLVGVILMKWRGQTVADFGLKRPRRGWWFVPVWAVLVLIAYAISQITVVPLLGKLLNVPPADFSRYQPLVGNLTLFLIITPGAMITGGFMEEFLYRGLMIDRLGRIFGGGKRALWLAAILNGVPFGLIHFEWGIGGILMTAVMGLVMGLMFLATRRNLWPLVLAHATLDFLLLLQVYLGVLDV